MANDRRKQLVLAGLAVVLTVTLYRAWTETSAVPLPSSNEGGRVETGPSRRAPAAAAATPDVHLESLGTERTKPTDVGRNLFRFKPKPAPPPPLAPPAALVRPVAPANPSGPPLPAPPQPIALKFIGVVEETGRQQKIAVLVDGQHNVFYGYEGATIEGRFRILRIGAESIEMAYLDGRGRQTIRVGN